MRISSNVAGDHGLQAAHHVDQRREEADQRRDDDLGRIAVAEEQHQDRREAMIGIVCRTRRSGRRPARPCGCGRSRWRSGSPPGFRRRSRAAPRMTSARNCSTAPRHSRRKTFSTCERARRDVGAAPKAPTMRLPEDEETDGRGDRRQPCAHARRSGAAGPGRMRPRRCGCWIDAAISRSPASWRRCAVMLDEFDRVAQLSRRG